MDVKDWLDFLFKKIEQIHKKNTISGINTYAIIGSLYFVIIRLYSCILKFPCNEKLSGLLLLWVFIGASISTATLLYYNINSDKSSTRDRNLALLLPLGAPHFIESFTYVLAITLLFLIAVVNAFLFYKIYVAFQITAISLLSLLLLIFFSILLIMKLKIPLAVDLLQLKEYETQELWESKKIWSKVLFCINKLIILVANPLAISIFVLAVYSQILISEPESINRENFELVCLSWLTIFLIGLLITKRKAHFLIDSLEKFQNDIMIGKFADVKEIEKEYEEIIIGHTLSQWAAKYWFRQKENLQRLASILEAINRSLEKQSPIRSKCLKKEKMSKEECKACWDETRFLKRMLGAAKAISDQSQKDTKRMSFVETIYRDTTIAKALLNKSQEAFIELKRNKQLIDKASEAVEELERAAENRA